MNITKLTFNLLDYDKYHTKALSFKKIIRLKEAFERATKLLRHKANNDLNLVHDDLFQRVVKIYEEQFILLSQTID